MKKINIIDLFAGPGGLGEGFSSFKHNNTFPFEIKASIEKEESAHRTLTLRSFFRKFRGKNVPKEYYEYIKNPTLTTEYLSGLFPEEWSAAVNEVMTQPRELGTDDDNFIFPHLYKLKKESKNPFIVIGGPPCQAYSVMGRIKNQSIKGYNAEDDKRHYLYKEYLKALHIIEPEVFVMENVRGIITAKVNDERIFPYILDDLKCPSKALGQEQGEKYHIYSLSTEALSITPDGEPLYPSDQDFVIHSEQYGIPQARHRVILLGVKENAAKPQHILKRRPPVTTDQMLEGMEILRSSVSRKKDCPDLWLETLKNEGKKLCTILSKHGEIELERLVKNTIQNLKVPSSQNGNKRFLSTSNIGLTKAPCSLRNFILDKNLTGLPNYFARSHMASDLQRYLFCSSFALLNTDRKIPSPTKKDFLLELSPNHKSWESGKFSDRFRVQFKGRYSSTITSHINKDGHFFIHFDPKQCRSLTVREAARLQTFPDNYFFEGNQTQQYIQVGNAVPPYLAFQIAEVVHDIIDRTNYSHQ